ncbi:MAG TPA: flavodoxin family protein [Candidatus Gallacutalibacter pullistercoris]|nr:flavodoxin family protein [Candidatus Gallacutalibacter pullistercoris]
MKVLLLNGSPNQYGCTHTALTEVAEELNRLGVETEEIWVGNKPVRSCIGCGGCFQEKKCVFAEDRVNECVEALKNADGFIVGAPVHYAGPAGACTAFLDRVFYGKSSLFAYKPAAAVVSCRRGGASAAFDRLNKYFTISSMPVVSSQYWNAVHGNTPDEVKQDLEGMQIMRTLARNMVWMLRCIEAGKASGVEYPEREKRVNTNFIR